MLRALAQVTVATENGINQFLFPSDAKLLQISTVCS